MAIISVPRHSIAPLNWRRLRRTSTPACRKLTPSLDTPCLMFALDKSAECRLWARVQLRPIFHQLEHRIEAHILVAFLAYCLHVTLRAKLKPQRVDENRLWPLARASVLLPIRTFRFRNAMD
jgi:hypothetical protein